MSRLRLRLRSLFRRRRVEQELDEEIRYHVERQTQELIAKGHSPEDAGRQALRAIGGVDQRKEECRDARRLNFIDDLIKDFRYAFRMLRRKPGFTAVAVLSLAVGIGANTAAFSAIDPLFLQRLPVPNAEQLVSFDSVRPDLHVMMPWISTAYIPFVNGGISYRQFERLRDRTQSFSGMFLFSATDGVRMIVDDNNPTVEITRGQRVSGSFFSTLGVAAAAGRTLTEDDDREDATPVAVV